MNKNDSVEKDASKKYLLLLIVLLFGSLSIIGVGYAYSSTVTHSGNVDNTSVILAINGNEGSELDFDLDWKSVTSAGVTTWTVDEEVLVDFTMGFKKSPNCDFNGTVYITVSVMKFAYYLTIGSAEEIFVPAGQALVEQEAHLEEGLVANDCSIRVPNGVNTAWSSATECPDPTVVFTFRATTKTPDTE